MISFTLSAQAAKDLIGSLSTLVEEAAFTATDNSIKFRGMDPSHVALIDVELAPLTYEGDGEKRFAVRVDELAKIIKRAGKDDVEIEIGGDDMRIQFGRRRYSLRLIEAAPNESPIPKIDYAIKYDIDSKKMADALADISVMSNFVDMVSEGGVLTFRGKGDTGQASTLPDTKPVGGTGTACYSLEYLVPFVKSVSGGLTVEYSEKKPCKVSVNGISFYLAPRVE